MATAMPNLRQMHLLPDPEPHPLYGVAATRKIESALSQTLPPHELMARAGLSLAQLTLALHPHARTVWVACGPGNNGGDALIAACHLAQWRQHTGAGPAVVITRCPGEQTPPDTRWALGKVQDAGLPIHEVPPDEWDVAIDGLLGLGVRRPPTGLLAMHWAALFGADRPVLCVDLPSGLDADTGHWWKPDGVSLTPSRASRNTLTMLTAKPGLFTADGRDAAGSVWLAPLCQEWPSTVAQDATLGARDSPASVRPHASHKGSQGDVVVIGGQGMRGTGVGMTGAGVLAARTALLSGAGRVFLGLLGDSEGNPGWDPVQPEIMLRVPEKLLTPSVLDAAVTVCRCCHPVAATDPGPGQAPGARCRCAECTGWRHRRYRPTERPGIERLDHGADTPPPGSGKAARLQQRRHPEGPVGSCPAPGRHHRLHLRPQRVRNDHGGARQDTRHQPVRQPFAGDRGDWRRAGGSDRKLPGAAAPGGGNALRRGGARRDATRPSG